MVCRACYMYKRRTGLARPYRKNMKEEIDPAQHLCTNCGTIGSCHWHRDKDTGGIVCQACYSYKRRCGHAHPHRRNFGMPDVQHKLQRVCSNCSTTEASAWYRGKKAGTYVCRTCYDYKNRTGNVRPQHMYQQHTKGICASGDAVQPNPPVGKQHQEPELDETAAAIAQQPIVQQVQNQVLVTQDVQQQTGQTRPNSLRALQQHVQQQQQSTVKRGQINTTAAQPLESVHTAHDISDQPQLGMVKLSVASKRPGIQQLQSDKRIKTAMARDVSSVHQEQHRAHTTSGDGLGCAKAHTAAAAAAQPADGLQDSLGIPAAVMTADRDQQPGSHQQSVLAYAGAANMAGVNVSGSCGDGQHGSGRKADTPTEPEGPTGEPRNPLPQQSVSAAAKTTAAQALISVNLSAKERAEVCEKVLRLLPGKRTDCSTALPGQFIQKITIGFSCLLNQLHRTDLCQATASKCLAGFRSEEGRMAFCQVLYPMLLGMLQAHDAVGAIGVLEAWLAS